MHLIRPVDRSDLPALAAIADATEIFPGHLLEAMASGYLDGDATEERWLTVGEGGPVAFAYYVREAVTDGTWNVLALAVHPTVQDRGHGTALMRHIERELAGGDAHLLLVETSGVPAFERTRAFYRGLGYEEEARVRDFYAPGDDKIIFRTPLRAGAGTGA